MTLDITTLIKVGERIVNDEQIGFAAEIKIPVQNLIYEGKLYQLQLVLTQDAIITDEQ